MSGMEKQRGGWGGQTHKKRSSERRSVKMPRSTSARTRSGCVWAYARDLQHIIIAASEERGGGSEKGEARRKKRGGRIEKREGKVSVSLSPSAERRGGISGGNAQSGPPAPAKHEPLLDAKVLPEALDVRDEVPGGVVL